MKAHEKFVDGGAVGTRVARAGTAWPEIRVAFGISKFCGYFANLVRVFQFYVNPVQ